MQTNKTTTAVSFFIVKDKMDKNGKCPIKMSLSVNGERKQFNCNLKCYPQEWGSRRQPQHIATYLDTMRLRVNEAIAELAMRGIPLTSERLKDYIQQGGIKSFTVGDLFEEYLDILKKRVGVDLTEASYLKYTYVRNSFYRIVSKDAEVGAITPAVLKNYQVTINREKELSTTCGMLTKLKTIVRYAVDNGYLKTNPWQGITVSHGKKQIEYLNNEDIEKLKNARFDNRSLQRVLDCALFQMSSGLAYCDAVNVEPQDLQFVDGMYVINKNRKKTSTEFYSVVMPFGVDVMNKYGGKMPFITCQKYNEYLKVIGDILGLSVKLHSHVFRHTYCTQLLNNGVPLKTISRLAGHSTVATTERYYAHLEEKTILNQVKNLTF